MIPPWGRCRMWCRVDSGGFCCLRGEVVFFFEKEGVGEAAVEGWDTSLLANIV